MTTQGSARDNSSVPSPFAKHFRNLKTTAAPFNTREWARVDAKIRTGAFFSATVEDEHLLEGIRSLCQKGIEEGWQESEFARLAKQWMADNGYDKQSERLQTMTPEEAQKYENSVRHIDSRARMRLIFRTQCAMASGVTQYARDMEPRLLYIYPGWQFLRNKGAKTFREDHVEHENDIRLKTDEEYWLARNDPEFGGFNLPHGPFGFNSWMRQSPVTRQKCVEAGIMSEEEARMKPKEWLAMQDANAKQSGQPDTTQRHEQAKQEIITQAVQRTLAERSARQIPEPARQRIIQRNAERKIPVAIQNDVIAATLPSHSPLDLAILNLVAILKKKKPKRKDFKTEKEYKKALETWQKKIKYLQSPSPSANLS